MLELIPSGKLILLIDAVNYLKLPRHPLLAKQAEVVSHAGAVARELISKKGL